MKKNENEFKYIVNSVAIMFDNDLLSIENIIAQISISDLIINIQNMQLAQSMIYKKFPHCKLSIFQKTNIVIGGTI